MTNRFLRVAWRMSKGFFGHMYKTQGLYFNDIKGVPTRRKEIRALCTKYPEGIVIK